MCQNGEMVCSGPSCEIFISSEVDVIKWKMLSKSSFKSFTNIQEANLWQTNKNSAEVFIKLIAGDQLSCTGKWFMSAAYGAHVLAALPPLQRPVFTRVIGHVCWFGLGIFLSCFCFFVFFLREKYFSAQKSTRAWFVCCKK